jgi:hypothetical protein
MVATRAASFGPNPAHRDTGTAKYWPAVVELVWKPLTACVVVQPAVRHAAASGNILNLMAEPQILSLLTEG